MPKNLGTETLEFDKIRSIDAFTVSIRPSGDVLDAFAVLERRRTSDNTLIESIPIDPQKFSQGEIEVTMGSIPELAGLNYATLRIGISKLIHALIDTRS